MSRYIARIIRAIIVSTLGFGGGVGLMVFIATLVIKGDQNAFQYGLRAGTAIGLVFAVLLVCVLLPLDLTAHLFLAKGKYRELWELEQTRELCFEGTLRELTGMCRQALLAVPAVKTVSEDPENRVIRAAIGMSWRSGGEYIDVEIKQEGENKWAVRCTSRPTSTNIVFDYGKNFENVETWLVKMNAMMTAGQKTA